MVAAVVRRDAHVVPRLGLGSGVHHHVVLARREACHGLLLGDEPGPLLIGVHFLHDAVRHDLCAVAVLDAVGNDAGDCILRGLGDVGDAPAAAQLRGADKLGALYTSEPVVPGKIRTRLSWRNWKGSSTSISFPVN